MIAGTHKNVVRDTSQLTNRVTPMARHDGDVNVGPGLRQGLFGVNSNGARFHDVDGSTCGDPVDIR